MRSSNWRTVRLFIVSHQRRGESETERFRTAASLKHSVGAGRRSVEEEEEEARCQNPISNNLLPQHTHVHEVNNLLKSN